jgi:hypothetical protein
MKSRSRAVAATVAAFLLLGLGSILAAVESAHAFLFVVAGFVACVVCGARALALWHVGEDVFERRRRPRHPFVVAAAMLGGVTSVMSAQQTIFNVPSDDVLEPGKVYLEVDELFRPTEPKFSSTTVRVVVGVFPRVEAGVNFGGLNAPGATIPTATVAVKLQPVRVGGFNLTAGGSGLFFLDAGDGEPAGLGYGFASYRIPWLGTRIDVGGWYSSAGYALPRTTGGALATFEQPIAWVEGLTVAADWFSGENSIGYLSPGLIYTSGHWTTCAAYSIKNGDSRGNGGLVELGYAF